MRIQDRLLDGISLRSENSLLMQMNLPVIPFEEAYTRLRTDENRIFSVDEIRQLPVVKENHPYEKEWGIRAWLANHLVSYLKFPARQMRIAEIGCGNGWLSGFMASQLEGEIVGIDLQRTELEQAVEAFGSMPNLCFVQTDVMQGTLPKDLFDVFILAESAQYIKDLPSLIKMLFESLKPAGEIHILGTPVYSQREQMLAQQRSIAYFNSIDTPEMAKYFFHHTWEEFQEFDYQVMYNPKRILHRIRRGVGLDLSPYPWIKILRK